MDEDDNGKFRLERVKGLRNRTILFLLNFNEEVHMKTQTGNTYVYGTYQTGFFLFQIKIFEANINFIFLQVKRCMMNLCFLTTWSV